MPHRHVQYTQVHPDAIEAQLNLNHVTTRSQTDTPPIRRGILADGSNECKLRWLTTGLGHELSWGVTSTPRRGVFNAQDKANGARVFVQGKAAGLDEASRLLQIAIRGVADASSSSTSSSTSSSSSAQLTGDELA